MIKRVIIYMIGMLILAMGLSLSTKLTLGVSALMAFPFSFSEIYGYSLGNVTFIYYLVLIFIQVIIHIVLKKYGKVINDCLQIVVSIIFTRVLDIWGSIIPNFGIVYKDMFIGSVYGRIILLIVAIVFIGVGASLTIDMELAPNPSDGIVSSLSDLFKIELGLMKNIVDVFFVIVTVLFSYVVSRKIVGIGIGTIISMFMVGRVIFIFNKLLKKSIKEFVKL